LLFAPIAATDLWIPCRYYPSSAAGPMCWLCRALWFLIQTVQSYLADSCPRDLSLLSAHQIIASPHALPYPESHPELFRFQGVVSSKGLRHRVFPSGLARHYPLSCFCCTGDFTGPALGAAFLYRHFFRKISKQCTQAASSLPQSVSRLTCVVLSAQGYAPSTHLATVSSPVPRLAQREMVHPLRVHLPGPLATICPFHINPF